MRKLSVICMIWTLIFCSVPFPGQAQNVYDSPSSRSKRICDSEDLNRIVSETAQIAQYRNEFELPSHNMLSASEDENAKEKQKWMKRHPVLFGTLVGFGIGFTVGLASGGGSDVSAGGMGLYFGAIGAGAGALIGSLASK